MAATTTTATMKTTIEENESKQNPKKVITNKDSEDSSENIIMFFFFLFFLSYTLVILFGETILLPSNEFEWCTAKSSSIPRSEIASDETLLNADYNDNPCLSQRVWQLLGMTKRECDFARRMIVSVLFGGSIGYERKSADRPAGIRTMSLVCLGACLFSMASQMAFLSSTCAWDAARVSAAIPSGVGFLGSALIWKGAMEGGKHEVHGLTTAASVWLSAAVGIGVGGRMYVVSSFAVALVILVLRLGPRLYFSEDSGFDDDDDDDDSGEEDEEEEEEEKGNDNKNESAFLLYDIDTPQSQSSLTGYDTITQQQLLLQGPAALDNPTPSRVSSESNIQPSPRPLTRKHSRVTFHG